MNIHSIADTATTSPSEDSTELGGLLKLINKPDTNRTVGYGCCPAHNGEILQGMFEENGRLHRALVSVPYSNHRTEAIFEPDETLDRVIVNPSECVKARVAAELALKACGRSRGGGRLTLYRSIPVGHGLGSSTADVVSAIRAVSKGCGEIFPAELVAEIAVKAEKASDASMFGNRAVLLAHREGFVLEYFGGHFPHLYIVGFNTDPQGGIDTLALKPAEYSITEIKTFQMLRALMRRAIIDRSAVLIGAVASSSARINNYHLPKLHFERLEKLVEDVGAVGLQVAHSGTVMGIMFDAACPDLRERALATKTLLAQLGFEKMWGFEVGSQRREVAE